MKLIKLKMKIVKHLGEFDNLIQNIDSCWQVLLSKTTSTSFGVSSTSFSLTFLARLKILTNGLISEAKLMLVWQTKKKKRKIIRWLSNCTKFLGLSCFEESREKWKRTSCPRSRCTSTLVSQRHRNPFIDNYWKSRQSTKELHQVTIKIFWFN